MCARKDDPAGRRASANALMLPSPAKINLFLHVTGKRPDGYHLLWTLMCTIGLSDTIRIVFGQPETTCTCRYPGVPSGPDNLAHRAAVVFLKHLADTCGRREAVAISIEKRIPAGAGLGGGSSNAAAVLLGLNRYFGEPLSKEALMIMGASLGADVPFFLYGGSALVRGIGDILEAPPPLRSFKIVLIYPGRAVSTAAVYKNLNFGLTNHEKKNKKILFNGCEFDPVANLHNDLEASAVSFCPEIAAVKAALLCAGARGALMSGSGSSVFGVFFDAGRAAAACRSLAKAHKRWQVFLTDIVG